jgi:hypothetical protein
MYAHVTDGVIDAVGEPPNTVFDGTRWWDLRTRDPEVLAGVGWFLLTEVARPADTATTTWDYSLALVEGVPTEVWTERPMTQAELDAVQIATNSAEVGDKISTVDLPAMQALIDTLNSTLNAGPATYMKDLAKAIRRLERRSLRDYTGTT